MWTVVKRETGNEAPIQPTLPMLPDLPMLLYLPVAVKQEPAADAEASQPSPKEPRLNKLQGLMVTKEERHSTRDRYIAEPDISLEVNPHLVARSLLYLPLLVPTG